MKSKHVFCLILGVALAGCAYYPAPSGIPTGSTKAQVQSILGSPKSTSRDGAVTTWNYGNGAVCVFRDGLLVASNINTTPGTPATASVGSFLPPVNVNFVPAPYYAPTPVVVGGYWGGGPYWGAGPYWGGGWRGWGGPWGGFARPGWGGYCPPVYRGNWNQGNWNRGNWNRGNCSNGYRR